MIIFGEEEKQIINKIVLGEGYSRNLINILDSLSNLQGVRISVDPSANTAEYLFQISSPNPSQEECQEGINKENELTQKLITHLLILESLDEEGLAFFFTPANMSTGKIEFGAGAVNMDSFSMPIYDNKIVALLIKYLRLEIIPKPALIHLHSNNYKSEEEKRFSVQMYVAWSALVVSIVIGLFGIYGNYESGESSEKKFKKITEMIYTSVGKLESAVRTLDRDSVNYSASIQEIDKSIDSIAKELSSLSKKDIIVNISDAPVKK